MTDATAAGVVTLSGLAHPWRTTAHGVWQAGNGSVSSQWSVEGSTPFDAGPSPTPDGIQAWLARQKGAPGVIVLREDFLFATPGRFRLAPLYYRVSTQGRVTVSDHPRHLLDYSEPAEVESEAGGEFLHAGYVTGRRTLIEGVKQLLPGEILVAERGHPDPVLRRGFVYPEAGSYVAEEEPAGRLVLQALREAMDDIVDWVGERRVILPLTGGYDSRLLAVLLAERGLNDVVCVTYDNGGRGWEVNIARRVAAHLGFRWQAVPHGAKLAFGWWRSEGFRDYQEWASGWSGMPHHQEWGTALHAKALGEERPSVVLSGICAGAIVGAFMPKALATTPEPSLDELSARAIRTFFDLRPVMEASVRERMRHRVMEQMAELSNHVADPREVFPAWEWQEREGKFISGALRTYDWHGVPWCAPFIDRRVCDAWSQVPPGLRAGKALHQRVVTSLARSLPAANLPEHRRSNRRIALRLAQRIRSRSWGDVRRAWKAGAGSLRNTAKLLHGDGWNAEVALERIRSRLPR